ncbi:MAG TPA: hypothetical protein VGL13_05955 [Polyangiaceae bacterium]|jgi:DNA-binding NtrC family response regulator
MKPKATIVLVENDEMEAQVLEGLLRADNHQVEHLAARWDVLARLTSPDPVSSMVMSGSEPLREGEILARTARWLRPGLPIILLGETELVERLGDLTPPPRAFAEPLDGVAFLRTLNAVA